MTYVEGFVTPVPTANKDKYIAHAEQAAAMFRDLGVTRFVECWGDDVPRGQLNDLWTAVDAKDDETVVFSWFEYPDRAARDAATARMMDDPAFEAMAKDMPFDGGRMIYGGFQSVSDARADGTTGYVDGVVLPLRADRRDDFTGFAQACAPVFIANGALRVIDTIADDVTDGERTDFNRAIRREDGELASYGWVEWPSKEARDAAWPKVMADPAMKDAEAPFDGKRMIFGGFHPIVER